MVFELANEERELLVALIHNRLRELQPEIRRSFDRDYRSYLKHEQEALDRLLQQLQAPQSR
jgi:hypothetical protein